MSTIDREAVKTLYDDVRNDKSDTKWFVMKYNDERMIVPTTSGEDYEEFVNNFTSEETGFGFVRVQAGDEMSQRGKFVLVTWNGKDAGVMQRARLSMDKTLVKDVCTSFAVEVQTSDKIEIDFDNLKDRCNKAGGACYGTGR